MCVAGACSFYIGDLDMGTRLYAATQDPIVLETLAKVPKGTMAKLSTLKEAFKDQEYSVLFDEIAKDKHLEKLNVFLMFGYGRIHFTAIDGCGGETDPIKANVILEDHFKNMLANPGYDMFDVMSYVEDIPLIVKSGGVYWC
jgi:hypothetical protein